MGADNAATSGAAGDALRAGYDAALPEVYGYLLPRCGDPVVAEDLTAETFLAAVDAVRRSPSPPISIPWLIGVARHKLIDHWRRLERERRHLHEVATSAHVDERWDERLDAVRAHQALARLGPHHRAVLTLRYLDDLPVADVAAAMGRTVHATEALLVRARRAFRQQYDGPTASGPGEEADRG
ncbi:MAG: RNA polymerase sigma factor [Mycobacteriales bacterium]